MALTCIVARLIRLVSYLVFSALCLTALCACLPPTTIPVETVDYQYKEGSRQECLVVFLPGRGAGIRDYEKEGFIEEARHAGVRADMIATGLHLGYYTEGSAFLRLRQDVILPAKARGYDCIWLVGISLGAYGALEYEALYPGEITGMVLFAPFLGGKDITDEIKAAGGLKKWEPGIIDAGDYYRGLWAWIKRYQAQKHDRPIIYLAYGTEDRFSVEDSLLAGGLAPDRVITGPGIHAWTTWKPLWRALLDSDVRKCLLGRPAK